MMRINSSLLVRGFQSINSTSNAQPAKKAAAALWYMMSARNSSESLMRNVFVPANNRGNTSAMPDLQDIMRMPSRKAPAPSDAMMLAATQRKFQQCVLSVSMNNLSQTDGASQGAAKLSPKAEKLAQMLGEALRQREQSKQLPQRHMLARNVGQAMKAREQFLPQAERAAFSAAAKSAPTLSAGAESLALKLGEALRVREQGKQAQAAAASTDVTDNGPKLSAREEALALKLGEALRARQQQKPEPQAATESSAEKPASTKGSLEQGLQDALRARTQRMLLQQMKEAGIK